MRPKAIEWTPHIPCNDEVHYDHVFGACGLGRFLISWKGWKDYPSYDVEAPWGEWLHGDTLDAAKAAAQDAYIERLNGCFEGDNGQGNGPRDRL